MSFNEFFYKTSNSFEFGSRCAWTEFFFVLFYERKLKNDDIDRSSTDLIVESCSIVSIITRQWVPSKIDQLMMEQKEDLCC